jgi:hypothetical protein
MPSSHSNSTVSPIEAVKVLGEKVMPDAVTVIFFASALNKMAHRSMPVRK